MGGVPYKKRLMVTKSIRISEELLKRVEAQLWNKTLESIPHGRQVEFYTRAVTKELERLEGSSIQEAIDILAENYAELGMCRRYQLHELKAIEVTMAVLKDFKQSKEREENATI